MLLDAKHKPWIWAVAGLAAASTAVYVPYHVLAPNGPGGGSAVGLSFGLGAFGLMLFAGLLGLRRRFPAWRVGRPETWLRAHLWLGLLAVPWTCFHAGFKTGGTLSSVLVVLLTLVTLSGILGIILQQIIPRMMMARLPMETIYEQIDHVLEQLLAEADGVLIASAGSVDLAAVSKAPVQGVGPLMEFYNAQVRPFLAGSAPAGPLSTPVRAAVAFSGVRPLLPPTLHEPLHDVEVICEERRQLLTQARLHRWLHGWLLVHVPLSYGLLLLAGTHAVVSVRF